MKTLVQVVHVIDDNLPTRQTLMRLLRSVQLRVAAYASAQAFLELYRPAQPGCVIADAHLPGMSAPALQRELKIRGATIPVIFLSGRGDIGMAVEAMKCGAFNFLDAPCRDQDLLRRVESALAADAADRLAAAERRRIAGSFESLTPRERDVLGLIVSGRPNRVMAADLGVATRTIEIHRSRVMEKMGAGSLAELVRMTVKAGLVGREICP
jgi:FixJ family two-component response regulator